MVKKIDTVSRAAVLNHMQGLQDSIKTEMRFIRKEINELKSHIKEQNSLVFKNTKYRIEMDSNLRLIKWIYGALLAVGGPSFILTAIKVWMN